MEMPDYKMYYIFLENGECYLIEKGFNEKNYRIIRGFLFRKKTLKRLGKIKEIREFKYCKEEEE